MNAGNWRENPTSIMEDSKEGVKSEEAEKNISEAEQDPGVYDRSLLPQYLKIYYKWLFPYDKYYKWLRYGKSNTDTHKIIIFNTHLLTCVSMCLPALMYLESLQEFSRREFSFALEDDVYVRFQSFDSGEALREGIRKFNPYKIDIGPIYSVKVNIHSLWIDLYIVFILYESHAA